MLRKSMLMTAICVSSVTMTGCSTLTTSWNSVGDMFAGVSSAVKTAFLRGPSEKSDISFAENVNPETGIYKTAIGEYVPTMTDNSADFMDVATSTIDTSPHPCPDGTYLTEDNSCMSLETDTYDFPDVVAENVPVDTSPVPCPEGTFLNAENACMYLETETYDFEDEVNTVEQFIDTSPVPCPEGTYLNAENQCMYLETETLDFAAEIPTDTPTVTSTSDFTPDFALNTPSQTGSIDCPKGFIANGNNSCMFLGEGPQSGN